MAIVDSSGKVLYEGCVLRIYSKLIQVMSDDWRNGRVADVWDDATQSLKIGVVFEMEGEGNTWCEVDATSDTLDKVFNYLFARNLKQKMDSTIEFYKNGFTTGVQVLVNGGRIAKGEKGKIFKMIRRPYKMGYTSEERTKLGIALDDEMIDVTAPNGNVYRNYKNSFWVWAHNCEVVDYMKTVDNVKETVNQDAFDQTVRELKSLMGK